MLRGVAHLVAIALLTSAGLAHSEPIGEASLWLRVELTGVHDLDSRVVMLNPQGPPTTESEMVRDKLVVVFDGVSSWPVEDDWTLGEVHTDCRVTGSGGGTWRDVLQTWDTCFEHGDVLRPNTRTQSGRWSYTEPQLGALEDYGAYDSPVGTLMVAPDAAQPAPLPEGDPMVAGTPVDQQAVGDVLEGKGTWGVVLTGMFAADELAPVGRWLEKLDFCHIHTQEWYPVSLWDSVPGTHDVAAVGLVQEAFWETVGGTGRFSEILSGTWDKAQKGFVRAGSFRAQGGEHDQPLLDDYPEGVPEGLEVGGQRSRYWTANVSYRATFTLEPPEIECIIEPPADYATWLPEGGTDEDTGGNALDLAVRLQVKGHPERPVEHTASFRFELVRSSSEPGVALNMPVTGARRAADLLFADSDETRAAEDGCAAISRTATQTSATARLQCRDYGAYGNVQVTATLDDGRLVVGRVAGQPEQREFVIPRDTNENHIADAWEQGLRSTEMTWDEEASPSPGAMPGDGLTLYEEYRGVVHDGQIIRLSGVCKDLLVANEAGPAVLPGLQLFEDASGVLVHELSPGELCEDRFANPNSDADGRGIQYGLRIAMQPLGGHTIAAALPADSPKASPVDCDLIAVADDISFLRPRLGDLEVQAALRTAIARELAHATGVLDHGDWVETVPDRQKHIRTTPPVIHALNSMVVEERPFELTGEVETREAGGPASGAEDCIMRDQRDIDWIRRTDEAGAIHYYLVKRSDPGTRLCADPAGTGINAPTGSDPESPNRSFSYFGDCAPGRGACLTRIRVKDWDG